MSIKERKNRHKQDLRQKIMQATAELLNKKGIDAVSIRNIASIIEYSPRTIYLHFKNKDDLLQQIIESGFAATVQAISSLEVSQLSPMEKITFFLRENIEMALQHSNYYLAVISIIHKKNFKMGPNQLKVAAFLNREIELIRKISDRKSPTPENTVLLIASFLRGFNVELIHLHNTLSKKQITQCIDQCISSIVKGVVE